MGSEPEASDLNIYVLWHQKRDTYEIARRLRIREAEVYNRLPGIREKFRVGRPNGRLENNRD